MPDYCLWVVDLLVVVMSGLQRGDGKWFRNGQNRKVEREEWSTSIDL